MKLAILFSKMAHKHAASKQDRPPWRVICTTLAITFGIIFLLHVAFHPRWNSRTCRLLSCHEPTVTHNEVTISLSDKATCDVYVDELARSVTLPRRDVSRGLPPVNHYRDDHFAKGRVVNCWWDGGHIYAAEPLIPVIANMCVIGVLVVGLLFWLGYMAYEERLRKKVEEAAAVPAQ